MTGRVVLGTATTGLGAARSLTELGHDDWDIYAASDHLGGLARDGHRHAEVPMGARPPHVQSLRVRRRLVAPVLSNDVERMVRRAYVWTNDVLIPYPLQHNIHRPPRDIYVRCLVGIRRAQQSPPRRDHASL